MVNEEWMVLGFGHKANREIVYDWSHKKTDCNLSNAPDATRKRLMETHYLKVPKNPDKTWDWPSAFFLTRNNVEQTTLEDELNDLGLGFTTINVVPTNIQKKVITKNRVATRSRLKEVIEKFRPIQSVFDAGGFDSLTRAQKDNVLKGLMLGHWEDL